LIGGGGAACSLAADHAIALTPMLFTSRVKFVAHMLEVGALA
jgi:hypothetical protein